MYNTIKTYLSEDWTAFIRQFESSIVSSVPLMQTINEYLLSHKGKQLRPMLCILSAKALTGQTNQNVIRCAASAELLHMATLLHDDVADNSDLRRGNPTVMAMYSPTSSVLVGDFWLSRAIRDITANCDRRTLLLFARCLEDLAEGEVFQLAKAESLDTTIEDYKHIIYCKTASLFIASVLSGAYSAGAYEDDCKKIESYAYHLGMSFQMMDDIFDYDPEVASGKPYYQDISERKMTIPLIGALADAAESERESIKESLKNADVEAVVSFVRQHKGIEYAYRILKEEIELAKSSLSSIPESDYKSFLMAIADTMLSRRN